MEARRGKDAGSRKEGGRRKEDRRIVVVWVRVRVRRGFGQNLRVGTGHRGSGVRVPAVEHRVGGRGCGAADR